MQPSPHVTVRVDLSRIVANAAEIRQRVGVSVLAVIKADAYGLGAAQVAAALGGVVDGFCVMDLAEAAAIGLHKLAGKPILTLGPPSSLNVDDYIAQHVRPAVWTVEQAQALRAARPILNVDTGMQRFACPPHLVDPVLRAGEIDEAFTHAIRRDQALRLVNIMSDRMLRLHAAGSALLDDPLCRLDAVRPGLALYRGAVRVSTTLFEARDTHGPAGYTGFAARRHGVIRCGYFSGLRPGPCLVNGQLRRIPEVGMQSAYVELGEADRAGDEVVLLGDALSIEQVATAWQRSPQDALVHLATCAVRQYAGLP